MTMAKKLRMDWFLCSVTTALAVFGTVMVYSASAMISLQETKNNPSGATEFAYFYKQAIFTLVGLLLMWFATRFDYHLLQKKVIVYGLVAITIVLLVAVYFFPPINGARRWIRLSGFSFQPSELAKLVFPLFLASHFAQVPVERFKNVLPCLFLLVTFGGLILFEPDLGTTFILCVVFGVVYFSAGARFTHLAMLALPLIAALCVALVVAPWRFQRLMAFTDPCGEEYASTVGYQVCQSLYAIGSGGIFGEGFARGQQKLFYLPYPYSDFIFAVIGEELGLIGTMAVVVAFALFLWRGARAALLAPDRFGNLLGIGIVTAIVTQAILNLSVVVSLLPAKGIPLPFISYGGSSIVVTLFSVGLLLNLSQHAGFVPVSEGTISTNGSKESSKRGSQRKKVKLRRDAGKRVGSLR